MRTILQKFKVLALPLASLCLFLCILFHSGYRFNVTHSMPRGVYRITTGSIIRPGQIVSFCLDDETYNAIARDRGYISPGNCPSGIQPLLKKVAGLAGDEVGFDTTGLITINGQPLPNTMKAVTDSAGRPAPVSRLAAGVIPLNSALVISHQHANGFDSRYFGLVPISSVHLVEPVFIF